METGRTIRRLVVVLLVLLLFVNCGRGGSESCEQTDKRTECEKNNEGAKCNTKGEIIGAYEKYYFWSSGPLVERCPNEYACKGCEEDESCCDAGYKGDLCGVCDSGYGRLGKACVKCINRVFNYFILFGVAVVLLGVVLFFIAKANDPKGKIGTVVKITINHFQMIAMVGEFRTKSSGIFQRFFNVASASRPGLNFLPVDCEFPVLNAYKKYELVLLIPLAAFVLPILFYAVFFVIRKIVFKLQKKVGVRVVSAYRLKQMITAYIVAVIVILFMSHTTLASESFQIFYCLSIGYDDYVLASSTDIPCYDGKYYGYFALAIVSTLVYSIGIPLGFFVLLHNNRHRLQDGEVKKRYFFLYSGYKPKYYFWELVVMAKKVLLGAITVFLTNPKMQTFSGLLLNQFFLIWHVYAQPFRTTVFNRLEALSLLVIFITLLGGVAYSSLSPEGVFVLTVFLLLVNIITVVIFASAIFIQTDTFEKHLKKRLQNTKLARTLATKKGLRRRRRRGGFERRIRQEPIDPFEEPFQVLAEMKQPGAVALSVEDQFDQGTVAAGVEGEATDAESNDLEAPVVGSDEETNGENGSVPPWSDTTSAPLIGAVN